MAAVQVTSKQKVFGQSKAGGCFIIGFGSIFLIAGVFITIFAAFMPLWQWQQSLSWSETNCVIKKLTIDVKSDSDGTTYRPLVSFDYQWKGVPYTSDRFAWDSASYGSRSSIENWIAPFRVGGEYPCYVNPEDPSEAVLVREFPFFFWIGLLMGIMFMGVGGGIASSPFWRKRLEGQDKRAPQRRSRDATMLSGAPADDDDSADDSDDYVPTGNYSVEKPGPDEPLVLKPEQTRWGATIGIAVVALIWNSFITFFAYMTTGIGGGQIEWLPTLFLIPFYLVGIGMIAGFVYSFLGCFNPKPTVVCSDRHIYPGSEFELSWMLEGGTSRISKLSIYLEGTESVTYRQGTSTRTETSCFYRQAIVETDDPTKIKNGFQLAQIPVEMMHSFEATNNRIRWAIRMSGKIPWWPDISDVFSFELLPPPLDKNSFGGNRFADGPVSGESDEGDSFDD